MPNTHVTENNNSSHEDIEVVDRAISPKLSTIIDQTKRNSLQNLKSLSNENKIHLSTNEDDTVMNKVEERL
jgi:hypothetical protein